MTKRILFLLLLGCMALGCGQDQVETLTVQIKGKPVNLVYVTKIQDGFFGWSYEGTITGKVGVCINGCDIIVEKDFTSTCSQIDTLSGKFNKRTWIGVVEGDDAGTQYCFVFIPEEGSHGEVRVTFDERRCCNGGW